MSFELCVRCGGTGENGCPDCDGTGSIEIVLVTPQTTLPIHTTEFVPRPNFCGDRYWSGYGWTQCHAQALAGETRCQRCKDHERARRDARVREAKEAAARTPQKGRRHA